MCTKLSTNTMCNMSARVLAKEAVTNVTLKVEKAFPSKLFCSAFVDETLCGPSNFRAGA